MLFAYITHPDCLRHEMGAGHPECPERVGAVHDQLLIKGLLDYMVVVDAPLATDEQLGRAHSPGFVRELIALSPAAGRSAELPSSTIRTADAGVVAAPQHGANCRQKPATATTCASAFVTSRSGEVFEASAADIARAGVVAECWASR